MRLVIIGSGIAGHRACRSALESREDLEVILVSKEVFPLYSPCVLPHYLAGQIPRDRLFLPADYEAVGGRVLFRMGTKVVGIDPARKSVLLAGEMLSYDRLILALGGYSVTPRIPGVDLPGVFHFKTLTDVDELIKWPAKRVVVVGSGPMGIEAALALNMRGMKVCLVEAMDRLLPAVLDVYPARIVQDSLLKAGIEVMVDEQVLSLEGQGRVEAVQTDKRRIPADAVVLTAGIRPAIDIAEEIGIEIGPKGGIVTDAFMRTSDPSIWACGDCVESFDAVTGLRALSMLWPNAVAQGSVAGINAAGGNKIYAGSFSFVTINLLDTFVFSFGPPFEASAECTVAEKTSRRGYARFLMKEKRLVGAQIIGDDSWTGITSSVLNRDRVSISGTSLKKHLIFQMLYSNKLTKLVSSLAG